MDFRHMLFDHRSMSEGVMGRRLDDTLPLELVDHIRPLDVGVPDIGTGCPGDDDQQKGQPWTVEAVSWNAQPRTPSGFFAIETRLDVTDVRFLSHVGRHSG